jgi:hypothetical protein
MKIFITVIITMGIISGCASMSSTVTKRAQHDFSCQDVNVTEISGGAFEAKGCNKKATYVCIRDHQTIGAPVTCTKDTKTTTIALDVVPIRAYKLGNAISPYRGLRVELYRDIHFLPFLIRVFMVRDYLSIPAYAGDLIVDFQENSGRPIIHLSAQWRDKKFRQTLMVD